MPMFGRKQREAPPMIDLREQAPAPLEFGYPTPCPDCAAPGYLDSIDVSRRVMFQHCPACWTKWETAEADLAQHV